MTKILALVVPAAMEWASFFMPAPIVPTVTQHLVERNADFLILCQYNIKAFGLR